jgi:hypothetical protein
MPQTTKGGEKSMLPGVKNMLDQLDTIFAENNDTAADLWAVLCALRGPDTPDDVGELKARTTNHIRRAALPKTAAKWDKAHGLHTIVGGPSNLHFGGALSICASFATLEDGILNSRPGYLRVSSHFMSHIYTAARVLEVPISTSPAP